SVAASISVFLVTIILLVPTLFVAWQIGLQAAEHMDEVERLLESGAIRETLDRFPPAARIYDAMNGGGGGGAAPMSDLAPAAGATAGAWLQALVSVLIQTFVAVFVLFFLFRDRLQVLKVVRSFMPMSEGETDYFFEQLRSMTHATIYG